jgi:transcriptional regulator with XRE-family HTH domain
MANDMQSVIVERRKALRMTQRDLAEKLNVSDQTISRWETGSAYPDASIIPSLAAALQIDPNTLFSKTSKDVLSKEDETDYTKVTKFRISVIVSSALLLLARAFAAFVHYSIQDHVGFPVFLSLMVVFAIGGIIVYLCTRIWFAGFYKSKFFTEKYRIEEYRWSLVFYSALVVFGFCYFYTPESIDPVLFDLSIAATILLCFGLAFPSRISYWPNQKGMEIRHDKRFLTLALTGFFLETAGVLTNFVGDLYKYRVVSVFVIIADVVTWLLYLAALSRAKPVKQ